MRILCGLFLVATLSIPMNAKAHGGEILNAIETAKHVYVIGHQLLVLDANERSWVDIGLNAVVAAAHMKMIHFYWKQYKKGNPSSHVVLYLANAAIGLDLFADLKTLISYLRQDFSWWTAPIYFAGPPCFIYNLYSAFQDWQRA